MLLLLINLAAGSTAATVYAFWAVRWARRRRPLLALVNAAVALTALAVAIGYTVIFVSQEQEHVVRYVQTNTLRPLYSVVLLLPALARWLELRRDARREAFARALDTELRETK